MIFNSSQLWPLPEKDLPWKTIPAPGFHPGNIPGIWLRLDIQNMQQRCLRYHMNISETDVTDWKYAIKKENILQYFKFEHVETFRRHSSFVFPWPPHRRGQCWPHRCRRGWRLEWKLLLSLPTEILLHFLNKKLNLDFSVLTLTDSSPDEEMFQENPSPFADSILWMEPEINREIKCIRSLEQPRWKAVGSCTHIWKRVWWPTAVQSTGDPLVGRRQWLKGYHIKPDRIPPTLSFFAFSSVTLRVPPPLSRKPREESKIRWCQNNS